MLAEPKLQHFYIPEEQSVYLLASADAQKLKDWIALCEEQLEILGYESIELIGKGAFGFAFAGQEPSGRRLVFKFSRITLPQHVQDRLEEEAFMLSLVDHSLVPALVEFQRVGKQSILVMEQASGMDLEQYCLEQGPLPPRLIIKIASQLVKVLQNLRAYSEDNGLKPLVHGDIKPSNIVFDPISETIGLIDWGSSVYAQQDAKGASVEQNVMDLMSADLQQTNARLGDVYFIGDDQLNGALSSPRFDEQGLASTLYAMASGQSSRFGRKVITPNSLGLPKELAMVLSAMLSDDDKERRTAGDYLMRNMKTMGQMVFGDKSQEIEDVHALLPTWSFPSKGPMDTVVYSSRRSFLREQSNGENDLRYLNDAQFERYYKNYMQGMGETEKAFIAAVSRLGKYPVVGGLALHWQKDGIYVDSSLNLYEPSMKRSFDASVNNVINLARAIHRTGVFKSCMFDARNTLHLERDSQLKPFTPTLDMAIHYEVSQAPGPEQHGRMHSYFEDGEDPDELLALPQEILSCIEELNGIHHTGCIIFESLPQHLKIHSYYRLLDSANEERFKGILAEIISHVPKIQGSGISGYMKLPYKDTRMFEHVEHLPEKFYPRNPLSV